MILNEAKLKRQLGGLQSGFSWAVISPYVTKAERWFRNQVGKELYNYVVELTPTDTQVDEKELQELAEGAVAFYAFTLLQPRINLKIGDAGMMKTLPSNHVAITKWEYVSMAESNQSLIDICMDVFWEQVAEIEPEVWLDSDDYKVRNELFIKDASELTNHLPLVNKSVRMYEALKNYIRKAERDSIEPTLTPAVYANLKEKLKGESTTALSSTDKKLLELVKDALALIALQSALPYMSVLIDTEGIRQVVKTDGVRNELEASYESKAGLITKLEKDGDSAMRKIIDYMKSVANEDLYPSFFAIHEEIDPFDIFSMDDTQHPIL